MRVGDVPRENGSSVGSSVGIVNESSVFRCGAVNGFCFDHLVAMTPCDADERDAFNMFPADMYCQLLPSHRRGGIVDSVRSRYKDEDPDKHQRVKQFNTHVTPTHARGALQGVAAALP